MTKVSLTDYFIRFLFFVYFAVLFAERAQSLIRTFADPAQKPFGDGFSVYVNLVSLFSLGATVLYLLCTNRAFFVGLFTRNIEVHAQIHMGALCIAAGILLVSGMVHTEYTMAPVQFGAYGALIVAMVLRTVTVQAQASSKPMLWLSLIYLTAFSMAIPVMYRAHMDKAVPFHVLEAITALALVFAFTFMLYRVFTGCAVNLFFWAPILVAVVLDAVLLWLRWQEQVNTFVLIFIIASAVLFAAGKILSVCVK